MNILRICKTRCFFPLAAFLAFSLSTGAQECTTVPSNGPFAGGNQILVTNTVPAIGSGNDITNVLLGGVHASITDQGTNWVTITVPATGSPGSKTILVQSTSVGDTTFAGIYTVNPVGRIGSVAEDWSRWEEVAGLPAPRIGLAAGTLNGAMYAIGGSDGITRTSVYRYNGTNWAGSPDLPAARYRLAAGTLNNALYAIAGENSSYKTNVYSYNGTNWTEVAGLPATRSVLAVGELNGSLYALGGFFGTVGQTNVYKFDGTNWVQVAGLPAGRLGLATGALNGALYAIGGSDNTSGPRTNVYRYNGTNWTEVVGLPTPRTDLAASVLGGALYAIGGTDGSNPQTNVYRYNGTNWTEVAGLPTPRSSLAAAVLNNALYAIAGNGGTDTNVYRYPATLFDGVSGVTPSSGIYTGGFQVIIVGTNLGNGSDITNVTLCGANVSAITSQSATQVVVTAGPAPAGLGHVVTYSTSYGTTTQSNAFTYIGPGIALIGTNGTTIVNGSPADIAQGTDFGHVSVGGTLTNTFTVTNTGAATLTISDWTIEGDASTFALLALPSTIPASSSAQFRVAFSPPSAGKFEVSLHIINDVTNFTMNFRGSAVTLSAQTGPFSGGNTLTITNGRLGDGHDITSVTVGGMAASITGQGTNWVTITVPATGSVGPKSITVQSLSVGDSTFPGVYIVNPPGQIGSVAQDWSRWEEVAGLPESRIVLAASVMNGAIYAIGGTGTSGTYTPNVYRYDGTNWVEVAALPSARGGMAAGNLNGALYAIGGSDVGGCKANVYRYNGTNWTETVPLPSARKFLAAEVLNNALFAVGGLGPGDVSSTNVYRYNGTSWSEVAGLPAPRYFLAAGVLNGSLYTVGGSYTNVYRYNGTNWTQTSGLPVACYGLGAGVLSNALYTVGGWNGSWAMTNVYRYNGATWTQVAGLPAGRLYLATAVLNDSLYAIGGSDGSNSKTNVYRYPNHITDPGVSPSSGSYTGGFQVVITGTNLGNGVDITNVTLCGVSVSAITSQSATQVIVTATASLPRLGDVVVYSSNYGITIKPNAFSYLKADQTITFSAVSPQSTTNKLGLSATASSGLPVSFSVGSGPATIANGTNLSFTGAGSVSIVASQPGNTNWNAAANLTNTFAVTKAAASIMLDGLTQTYDGTPRVVTATSTPTGLSVLVTYNGNGLAPSNVGSYAVTGTVNEALYQGTTNGTLVVTKAVASVTLNGLAQTYDGTPRVVTASSTPTGLAVLVSYDGSGLAPSNAGNYAVTGTVNDASYKGSTNATLQVAKAAQTILFPAVPPQKTSGFVRLTATASSALPVVFSIAGGPGLLSDGTNLTFTGIGNVRVVASQIGDSNYNSAPDVTRIVKVYQVMPTSGPFSGGNQLSITNGTLGNGFDITSVLVDGAVASITGQGTNWVTIIVPPIGTSGDKDIAIQSTSAGGSTFMGAYTVNPAGQIVGDVVEDWTQVAGLPTACYGLAAGSLNGSLYALGGYGASGTQTNVYRYNGTTWTQVAGLPSARYGLAAAVLNGSLYAIGGYGNGDVQTNVYRYNGTNWAQVAGLPAARDFMAADVLNGALYVIGGWNGLDAQTNVFRYNGTNWQEVAGLPAVRYGLAAAVLNGVLYAAGGSDGNVATTNVFRYDGTNWQEVAGMSLSRDFLAAGVLNDSLFTVGGSFTTNVLRYNTTVWREVAGLLSPRSYLAVGVLNDSLYALGGSDGTTFRTNVYRYPHVAGILPGVIPTSGSYTGGFQVVITGTNLGNGVDITNVTLCGVSVSAITSQSATQVVVTAGPAPPGIGHVVTYSTSYGATTKSNVFVFNPAISVSFGTHGAVTPNGVVDVAYGGGTSFVVGADTYYHIGSLLTNGANVAAALNRNTFTSTWLNVRAPGVLGATFAENITTNTATPEWWLAQYGWTNNFHSAATNDPDGDRMPTWAEYSAGTDPTNQSSFLGFDSAGPEIDGPGIVVRWQSVSGKLYRLERGSNLTDNSGFGILVRTNILGIAPMNTETDKTTTGSGPWFYRVKLE